MSILGAHHRPALKGNALMKARLKIVEGIATRSQQGVLGTCTTFLIIRFTAK